MGLDLAELRVVGSGLTNRRSREREPLAVCATSAARAVAKLEESSCIQALNQHVTWGELPPAAGCPILRL